MILAAIVALPWIAAFVVSLLPNRARTACASLGVGAAVLSGVCLTVLGPTIFSGPALRVRGAWLPFEGANFGFRLDGLAWVFCALIIAIGALVMVYARYYLSDRDPLARFYAYFLAFMGAMLGLVLADNLLLLAIFWELTSVLSFLLVGYWSGKAEARGGARMALTVTGLGGLSLLAGVIVLGHIVGSYDLEHVLAAGDVIRASPHYPIALALILGGVFTKSAQVPLHFWLPQAMAAPTPVSAFLHSATMVKAGVFLLARLYPALAGTDLWFYAVGGTGLVTMLVGAYIAAFQHDIKGLLAYSTISHLGLITLLFGLNSPLAAVAGVFHILNHATFKASLFMAAGIIDHETGTRDMRRLAGLARYMPVTAALAIISSSAMAGVPLLNGFLSKEMFFAESLAASERTPWWFLIPALATLAASFSVAYSLRFIHDVFWNGEPKNLPRTPHDPPVWMLVPVGVLAVLCLLVGIFPQQLVGPVLDIATRSTLGGTLPEYSLAIWHGWNLPFVMSLVALFVGIAWYVFLQRIVKLHDRVHLPRAGKELYNIAVSATLGLARAVTRVFGGDGLQRSIALLVAVALVLGSLPFFQLSEPLRAVPESSANPVAIVVALTGLLGIAATVFWHRRRLTAVIALGLVGLVVCLTFAANGAPDLALTQLLVEFVSIVLLLLGLSDLPRESEPASSRQLRVLHAIIAITAGFAMALLTWTMLGQSPDPISEFFLTQSLPAAFGTNVVNVIIVDFRGFDTLGEITVLALAALVVGKLIRGVPSETALAATENGEARSVLLAWAETLILPLAVLVSIYLFLRGHDQPGGGFVAGLVLAVGWILPYLAYGKEWAGARLPRDYERLVGSGLLIAGATGVAAMALGNAFLASSYATLQIPLIGKLGLASALFIDLGVYCVVTGSGLLMLSRLIHGLPQSTSWSSSPVSA